jgi:hypothetical protein
VVHVISVLSVTTHHSKQTIIDVTKTSEIDSVKLNCRKLTKKNYLRGKQAETLIKGSFVTGTI